MSMRNYNSEKHREEINKEKSVAYGTRGLVKKHYSAVEYGKRNPGTQIINPGTRKSTKHGIYDPANEAG